MADPFVAEVRILPFTFAPSRWALCSGQLMPISQNTALFSLLGTTYGGNGTSNFALPNLDGRVAMHPGQGPGLSLRNLGETGGSSSVTLNSTQMPLHTHTLNAQSSDGAVADPTNNALGNSAGLAYTSAAPSTTLSPLSSSNTGGSLPHNNMMPHLMLSYCIALQGVYPARS